MAEVPGGAMFPIGGGELGRLIRAHDWSPTPIGPLAGWPQSLKSVTQTLLLSPVPIVLLWGIDGVMIYNDAYSVFAGSRHPQLLGSKVREGWAEIADFNDHVMRVGLAGETLAYRNQELTLRRHGKPEPVWMDLDYSPVLDESGAPAGVIAIVVETTGKVLTERRLVESEKRFRALVDASSDILYQMSPDWTEMRRLDRRTVVAEPEVPGASWMDDYLLPEDLPAVRAAIDAAVTGKTVFKAEHRVRRSDGSTGWVASRAVPMLDDAGDVLEWFGAATDVTERNRTNAHLRLVINEMNHRVKNMLAMVQAIAARTFGAPADLAIARSQFAARLVALAEATDLLTGERWAGASLRTAIAQVVLRDPRHAARCALEGDDVRISPKTALALSLAMHELATNAAQFGAWSTDGGRVAIRWRVGPDRTLHLDWQEHSGPPVDPPVRRGFGTRLIERGLAGELGGEVRLDFDSAGVRCTIRAPMTFAAEA